MNFFEIIEKKKNKQELEKEEIEYFVENYTKGNIPDYQASALLMAICINGMSDAEIFALTEAMTNSGDTMDLSGVNGTTVDKHSTGGVGDKTTLILLPIVACLGGKVAKMSGRGLGYTGGTIDKLEAIPGFNVSIPQEKFIEQVNQIGACLVSQTGNLTPADKKIYALRDVTATVDSIPLIASSVMSKKIAAGSDCIVLDVKVGSGAFMKNVDSACELARKMVTIGQNARRKTMALITNMDIPLGNAIGNALEVQEAIQVLNGNGPKDLTNLCVELASYMLALSLNKTKEECEEDVRECIKNGKALDKFREIVSAQGGNINELPQAKYKIDVLSPEEGYIAKMDTEQIGKISGMLGSGRIKKEDEIDYGAGIVLKAKTGNYVRKGELIAELYTSKAEIEELKKEYISAIYFSEEKPEEQKLIYDIIEEVWES